MPRLWRNYNTIWPWLCILFMLILHCVQKTSLFHETGMSSGWECNQRTLYELIFTNTSRGVQDQVLSRSCKTVSSLELIQYHKKCMAQKNVREQNIVAKILSLFQCNLKVCQNVHNVPSLVRISPNISGNMQPFFEKVTMYCLQNLCYHQPEFTMANSKINFF